MDLLNEALKYDEAAQHAFNPCQECIKSSNARYAALSALADAVWNAAKGQDVAGGPLEEEEWTS